ncbi:GIY-YIG nuclease family protein [Shumkonia mesophila]|uniref:GIY-YIG nuclease family protein n=1 Tax=Shumkonia mesophila TaxID=2838854 RepID=UPI002934CBBD|nr:GIY-YIG nuclease family protein [Shumkonia mesophila]
MKPPTRDVYVIYDSERAACKIGVSNCAEQRFCNLQTGSSVDLELTHIEKVPYPLGTKVERTARKILTDLGHPKTREWIGRCFPDQARDAIVTAHEIERARNANDSVKPRMNELALRVQEYMSRDAVCDSVVSTHGNERGCNAEDSVKPRTNKYASMILELMSRDEE